MFTDKNRLSAIIFWGRAAADMENLAAITLAVAWYWKRRERPNFCSYIVFYLICSLGAQAKGLTAIVVPIVAVLPDFLRERRWKMHLSFFHLMALAFGAAIYLCPLIWERKGHRKPVARMIFD
jgi:4-amino-4-deoxy-L-arabinose transferase-like glycosyltransferase